MRIAVLGAEVNQSGLIQYTMAGMGHKCHSFTEGRSLLHEMREQTFDLLILDWTLPDVSGLTVVKWIRRVLANPLPILFVATPLEEAEIVKGLVAGANQFITRPVHLSELEARVTALLRHAYEFNSQAADTAQKRPRLMPLQSSPLPHALMH